MRNDEYLKIIYFVNVLFMMSCDSQLMHHTNSKYQKHLPQIKNVKVVFNDIIEVEDTIYKGLTDDFNSKDITIVKDSLKQNIYNQLNINFNKVAKDYNIKLQLYKLNDLNPAENKEFEEFISVNNDNFKMFKIYKPDSHEFLNHDSLKNCDAIIYIGYISALIRNNL